MILLGGLTLIAMVVLTPAWLDLHQLSARKKVMQVQADRLAEQRARYQQVYDALNHDDPLLLERLAYTRLRLQPRGKDLLSPPPAAATTAVRDTTTTPTTTAADHAAQRRIDATAVANDTAGGPGGVGGRADPIDRWLRVPPPRLGVDITLPRPVNTELTRLSQGWRRVGILAGAGACVLGALLWGAKPSEEAEQA